jgi:hypothetical protein
MKPNYVNRNYYIMRHELSGNVAAWTLRSNLEACWHEAISLNWTKKDWLKDGWKCVRVRLEAA